MEKIIIKQVAQETEEFPILENLTEDSPLYDIFDEEDKPEFFFPTAATPFLPFSAPGAPEMPDRDSQPLCFVVSASRIFLGMERRGMRLLTFTENGSGGVFEMKVLSAPTLLMAGWVPVESRKGAFLPPIIADAVNKKYGHRSGSETEEPRS